MNVEYHKLRPKELLGRREARPVAYLGFGVLEWHSFHNPLGLDGLKAHGLACYLAEKLGGLAMPPQYYADNRNEICELHLDPEHNPQLPQQYHELNHATVMRETLKHSKQAFVEDAQRSLADGGWDLWEKIAIRMFFQIQTLGFKFIVAIPGHYPLFDPLQRAIDAYHDAGGTCEVLPLPDTAYDPENNSGDHAAAFETSALMMVDASLVDLSQLDEDLSKPNIGVVGEDPRTHANLEYGEKIFKKFAEVVEEQLKKAGL